APAADAAPPAPASAAGTNSNPSHGAAPAAASADATDAAEPPVAPAVAQARALAAILDGDLPAAQALLRGSLSPRDFNAWAAPLLKAAANARYVPDALQAITRAANEERMDAATEILCGAALRQGEFVFN